ncbi:2-dehydro-3-deoxyglucarate aldolase [Plantibacter sp. Leaf171]|uniref:HpcH/HpaI aldolase family protein n=1 Tax=unclassified Plantibacter TaxID=2624265 RepID=UPI0006FA4329|nr:MULTISPECIES: HpcH/HpaI aldolase/citrate lyase family protein [unclassified Plantibacter]KQM16218.1 2-dehydro-3-deoxyglucarate aldolase [Plantibacter sp. Leaf1]KQR59353.1 2-dehydro-3-deoxyglucarate aldolase [Plantibacter sp. Leaf171]
MPIRMTLPPTFGERLRTADRPLVGMWVVSGSPVAAEIAAGSGLDLLLIDGEHSANTLESIQLQLQLVAAFPVCPLVRVPFGDPVVIKQVLDLGAQNLIVPMVESAAQATELVRAVRYPPQGVRGVGSALARSSRWNRVDDYLSLANGSVSLTVQIESADAVEHAAEILAVDGVDAVFVGPADLSASMGLLGQQGHPTVIAAVERVLDAAAAAGKPAGVNAFDPVVAEHYLDHGASFVLVGADVSLLARASEGLAERFIDGRRAAPRGDGY